MRQENKIVSIAHVILHFEFMPHELVKLVRIDIHEKLGRKIAEWESYSSFPKGGVRVCEDGGFQIRSAVKTPNNVLKQVEDIRISNITRKD